MTASTLVFLSGNAVKLREFTSDDLDDVSALVGDDRVTEWLSFDSRSRQQASDMLTGIIERRTHTPRTEWYFAVETQNVVIGFARLGLAGIRAAKLGYAIRADQWGNGYASDAVLTIARFGFGALNLHRISAAIGPDNVASIAVAQHIGMQCEGRIRDHVFTNGHWRDSLLFAVLEHELQSDYETPLGKAHRGASG